jgi:hypothetical protein
MYLGKFPMTIILEPLHSKDYDFSVYLKFYTSRPVSVVDKNECLSTKSVHAFPSYIIIDLGHKDIRFYVLQEHQIVETYNLGFGGSAISEFFVMLLTENGHKYAERDGSFVFSSGNLFFKLLDNK